jgi:hypothetical protein
MAAQSGHVGGEFRIGRVLGRAFGIWARNIVPFTLIALVATLQTYAPRLLAGSAAVSHGQALRFLPFALTTLVVGPLCGAIFTLAVFQDLAGEKVRFGVAIARALARLLPLIACVLCVTLALVGGLILLVIPGFIVMTMLSVATQACVIEKLGPIESLSRSAALTKGRRWRVFGFILLIGLISSAAGILLVPLDKYLGLPGVIVAYLAGGLASAYGGTAPALLFNDLRVSKEGIGTERIASVFD